MLIPKPVVIQYRKTVAATMCQFHMNKPAIAPTCNMTMAMVVPQFNFCWLGKLMMSVLTESPGKLGMYQIPTYQGTRELIVIVV